MIKRLLETIKKQPDYLMVIWLAFGGISFPVMFFLVALGIFNTSAFFWLWLICSAIFGIQGFFLD